MEDKIGYNYYNIRCGPNDTTHEKLQFNVFCGGSEQWRKRLFAITDIRYVEGRINFDYNNVRCSPTGTPHQELQFNVWRGGSKQ